MKVGGTLNENCFCLGNRSSGKTTMYNALTGKNERVGNWAGVTIGRKESPIKADYANTTEELMAVDLPGAYSMSPFTPEESITSGYVRDEHPDAIINIVDATNLSRSLFFTTQLLELGIPVVVALNKSDINEKQHTQIDVDKLARSLGYLLSRRFPRTTRVCRTLSRRLLQKTARVRRLLTCRQKSTCTIKKPLTQRTESVSHS